MIFITFQVGVKWVKIITFFPCLEMIFKQYYTITIFHVYYPPSLPRVSQAPLSSHECLVQPTCHMVLPTRCMVRPLQPPLQLPLHSQQILNIFLSVFSFSRGKKTFFFKNGSKNVLVSKKQKLFLSLSVGGGQTPNFQIFFFFN